MAERKAALDSDSVRMDYPGMETVTYTDARERLAELWDKALSTREPIILKRRGRSSVSLIPTEELSALMETAHLLRSPANARRLLAALHRSHAGKGKSMTIEALRARFDKVRQSVSGE